MVDGIWCISPRFKPQIIKTVASIYISAAGKQVSRKLAGKNETDGAYVTNCTMDMKGGSMHNKWLMVSGAYRNSLNHNYLRPWLLCLHLQQENMF